MMELNPFDISKLTTRGSYIIYFARRVHQEVVFIKYFTFSNLAKLDLIILFAYAKFHISIYYEIELIGDPIYRYYYISLLNLFGLYLARKKF
jgi:hypothetical protein